MIEFHEHINSVLIIINVPFPRHHHQRHPTHFKAPTMNHPAMRNMCVQVHGHERINGSQIMMDHPWFHEKSFENDAANESTKAHHPKMATMLVTATTMMKMMTMEMMKLAIEV